jgi:predicted nucleic acid-binding protein
VIVADTSGLLALFNAGEPRHAAVRELVADARETLVVSPYVVAELDYVVSTRIGVGPVLAVVRELCGPGYELAAMNAPLLADAAHVVETYADLNIGVTDASLVVLAAKYRTDRILTLDRRHFAALRTSSGKAFTLLPM